uniref:Uncharacterized protein n=1 Tax=Anguilla anguilla TaxID=7936 RepID=A0A0E9Q1K3_ANGAN
MTRLRNISIYKLLHNSHVILGEKKKALCEFWHVPDS